MAAARCQSGDVRPTQRQAGPGTGHSTPEGRQARAEGPTGASMQSGRVVFRKRSPHSLYAVVAWTAAAVIAFQGLLHWIQVNSPTAPHACWPAERLHKLNSLFSQVTQRAGYFSLKAYYAFFVIIGHAPLLIPLLHWPALHHVARAFNYSHQFQANFQQAFGVPLRLGMHRRALATGIVSPLFGVAVTFWAHFYGYLPWRQFPTYELSATYLAIVPGTWQLAGLGLETSAQRLLHQLHQLTQVLGRDRDAARARLRLREARWLWLQLDHSARLWARAWTHALAHLLLFSMATVLLSIFGVMMPLLRAQGLSDQHVGLVVGVGHNCHNIYALCTAGYRVRTQVRDTIIKELLRVKLPSSEAAMYKEVLKFTKAIDMQDTKISLRGYVTINRTLIIKCATLLLTYVIVLLQFAYAKGAQ
ncbi:gustatory and odorant receptor 63a-like [Thrips palmi]|uniref:Gustatory receptor n=1 Tax=Thrips palmi TaxID=161013 RepID=A0A6P8YCI1_THRPL|nr:gustatory and odorant receptor 63a-like [Thrips palmi]